MGNSTALGLALSIEDCALPHDKTLVRAAWVRKTNLEARIQTVPTHRVPPVTVSFQAHMSCLSP